MKRWLVVMLVAAMAALCAAPIADAQCQSANGRWVTTTTTTWVPTYTHYWQEQVGWHYDGYGNQYPIMRTFWRVVPGHFETRTYRYWRWN